MQVGLHGFEKRGRKGFCVKRDRGLLVLRDPLSENNRSREP